MELPRGGAVMGQPGFSLFPPFSPPTGIALWCLESACQQKGGRAPGGLRPHPSQDLPQAQVASDRTTPSPASLPTVHGIKWTCSNGNSSSGFSVEQLVQQILDSHQTKPPPRTHNCLCTGSLGEPGRQQACGQRALPGSGCDVQEGRGVSHDPGHSTHGNSPSSCLARLVRLVELVGLVGLVGLARLAGQPPLGRREQSPDKHLLLEGAVSSTVRSAWGWATVHIHPPQVPSRPQDLRHQRQEPGPRGTGPTEAFPGSQP